MKTIKTITLYFVILTTVLGCKKYLDEKPDKKLDTPNTLPKLQSLLDDYARLNVQWVYAGEVASDDFYVTDSELAAVTNEGDRRMYTWEKDNLFQGTLNSWNYICFSVYYGNTVLENIEKIERNVSNEKDWDNIKGQGYFYKGIAMLTAAHIWAPVYNESTAAVALGLPIRTSTDFNIISTRSSLKQTYGQLISDLKNASALLPVTSVHNMRPSKRSSYAMLSRAYLSMNKYEEAALYADSALMINSSLVDYNNLSLTSAFPFPEFSGETIFNMTMPTPRILQQATAKIADELYRQYGPNDLRKQLFFKSNGNGTYAFKGNYSGNEALFSGPAVDEMYLNRAESNARLNKLPEALTDLNALMVKRWNKNVSFPKFESSDKAVVINWILVERRKELLMRGLRWVDLKRLNGLNYAIQVVRYKNTAQKSLAPNDLRYAMPLPEAIIELTGMSQNP